jgi:hypothetical protein
MERDLALPRRAAHARVGAAGLRGRLGGARGNARLTRATAVVLTALLAVQGVTVVHMDGLVRAHLFIGLALIPPIALKLASTGYRFVRYYTGARAYREAGPPRLPLRLLAPVLIAATVGIFVSGVLLLAAGGESGALLEIHKLSFVVWGIVFVVHFVAYAPRVARSVRTGWTPAVAGARLRALAVALATAGGLALALSLLHVIQHWDA